MSERLDYNPTADVYTVDGIKFAGGLIREWKTPTDRLFQFKRRGDVVTIQQVLPCKRCAKQFNLYKQPICEVIFVVNDLPTDICK